MHWLARVGVSAAVAAASVLTAAAQDAARFQVARPAHVLAGTPATAFTTIQGTALDATNHALPNRTVRLRDARTGRIAGAQLTDRAGIFAFTEVDPGSYVVELIGKGSEVLAASELLNVNAGEATSVVVKLPFRPTGVGGWLRTSTPAALAVATSAAATGVLAVASTTDVSPDGTR
jgi:hypothetical protein